MPDPTNYQAIHNEAVSEKTREYARGWLMRFQDEMQRLGYTWTVPHAIESSFEDEVVFEWNMNQPPRRWLHVYVEPKDDAPDEREVWYLRAESNEVNCEMLEGYADDLEACRLLWHWFLYGKVNL